MFFVYLKKKVIGKVSAKYNVHFSKLHAPDCLLMNRLASPEMVTAVWICLAAYVCFILFFVIRGAIRTKSIADYAVGSINFNPVILGFSLAASMSSAATFIINPGFIAYYGLAGFLSMGVFLPIGTLVSLYFLSKSFRKIGKSIQAKTLAQWMGIRYQSKNFALYFAFLSVLMIAFVVLICVGLTKVISTSLNLEILPTLIAIVFFTFGYMMFGGANSMVYTNMIQAMLKVVVAIILLTSGFEHFSNGVHGFLDKLSAIDPQLSKPFNSASPLYRDFFEVVVCQLIVGFAIVCQPHILTRSLFLKNDRDVNKFLIAALIVQAIFFLVVFVGLYARLHFPNLQANGTKLPLDGVMPAFVVSNFPVYLAIIIILGMIAAGMSTLEGLIQSLSTTITSDIIKPLTGSRIIKNETGGIIPELWMNRIVIILFAIVSIIISYGQLVKPDLSVGIFAQNGVYAFFSAAFVPVLFGIFLKDAPVTSVAAASVTAVVVHFGVYYGRLTSYMQTTTRNPGVAAALAVMASLVVGITLYYALRKKEKLVTAS
jgi:sodium/pantothenate symporter